MCWGDIAMVVVIRNYFLISSISFGLRIVQSVRVMVHFQLLVDRIRPENTPFLFWF